MWVLPLIVVVLLFGLTVFRGAPYVPTKRHNLKKAFRELYPLSSDDLLVDIGSGDGIVLREAARCGARAIGYELNPILVLISRIVSRQLRHLVTIRLADFWLTRLPDDTTIVYTFGESRDIQKMYQKVQKEASRLRKPLYFMSYGFMVPGQTILRQNESFFLYHVPPLQETEAQV